ncbi:hypothetical protein FQN57_001033 [Myotisia sp. PD_48]|nr:hypothetical protein FQN57_001033 [Myotisia sp. PD_48]
MAFHDSEIFSLAVTPSQIICSSGSASIQVVSNEEGFPISQTLSQAHKIGCHHLAASEDGSKMVSVGFDGAVLLWQSENGIWNKVSKDIHKISDIWAVALSANAQYITGTTHDGHIKVWDTQNGLERVCDFETRGSFGLCLDVSPNGRLIASGHQSGNVYVFELETGRMPYTLSGLVAPIRAVAFSPKGKFLAVAGDFRVIALYETASGEQVANLTGHSAWITTLAWNSTDEYLLSGSFDGKVKVWSIERKVCVATLSDSEKPIWSVKWLPRVGNSDRFAIAGANRSVSLYREPNSK